MKRIISKKIYSTEGAMGINAHKCVFERNFSSQVPKISVFGNLKRRLNGQMFTKWPGMPDSVIDKVVMNSLRGTSRKNAAASGERDSAKQIITALWRYIIK